MCVWVCVYGWTEEWTDGEEELGVLEDPGVQRPGVSGCATVAGPCTRLSGPGLEEPRTCTCGTLCGWERAEGSGSGGAASKQPDARRRVRGWSRAGQARNTVARVFRSSVDRYMRIPSQAMQQPHLR